MAPKAVVSCAGDCRLRLGPGRGSTLLFPGLMALRPGLRYRLLRISEVQEVHTNRGCGLDIPAGLVLPKEGHGRNRMNPGSAISQLNERRRFLRVCGHEDESA